jgi:hypothetical protein
VRSQTLNKLEVQQEGQLSGHSPTVWMKCEPQKKRLVFEQVKRDSKRGQLSGHLLPGVVERSAEKWGVRYLRSSKCSKWDSWAGTYILELSKIIPMKGPKMWEQGTAGKVKAKGIAKRDSLWSRKGQHRSNSASTRGRCKIKFGTRSALGQSLSNVLSVQLKAWRKAIKCELVLC